MPSLEQQKLMSLKIASLPQKDQKWLLARLPEQDRQCLSESVQFLETLKVRKAGSVLKNWLCEQSSGPAKLEQKQQTVVLACDAGLAEFLRGAASGNADLTEDTRTFIQSYLAGKTDETR